MAHWAFAVKRTELKDGDVPVHGCYFNSACASQPVIAEAYSALDAEVLRQTLYARYGDALVLKIDGEIAAADLPLV